MRKRACWLAALAPLFCGCLGTVGGLPEPTDDGTGATNDATSVGDSDPYAPADTSPIADTDAGPPFSAITVDQGGTLSAPPDVWSFGTKTCASPCSGNNVVLNGQQAGSDTLLFAQLVVDNDSGDVYGQSVSGVWSGLWWRWNGVDQWTPEVTGDPRSPAVTPALGPNKLANPDFAGGAMAHWFVAATGDKSCATTGTCSYKVEQLSPDDAGYSFNITTDAAHPYGVEVGGFFGATVGATYLVSLWSTGSAGSLHEEHDTTGSKSVSVLPTTGWVQSFCKFVPVKPSNGQLMIKVYSASSINVTHFYAGEVAADYPAPVCKLQY
jgi:hypothetical protein